MFLGMGVLEFAIIVFVVLLLFAPRLGKLGKGMRDARRASGSSARACATRAASSGAQRQASGMGATGPARNSHHPVTQTAPRPDAASSGLSHAFRHLVTP